MKKIRWQLIIIFITGLVVGILLLSDTTTGPIQIFESQPTSGGTYIEGTVGTMQRLNPLLSYYNNTDQDICRLIYSGLVRFDNRGLPQADLAREWGISMDGKIYNFAINPDARWHDGQPVTSDDVVFTYEMIKQASGYLPEDLLTFWAGITIRPIDPKTVQFELPDAYAPFISYLNIGILPKHIWANMSFQEMVNSKVNIQPVGSGPYKLGTLKLEGSNITGIDLVRNGEFYRENAFLEEIQIRFYPDSTRAYQAYEQGLVDGISYVGSDILYSVLAQENLSLYTARLPIITMILLNNANDNVDFFKNADIRKALLAGINRTSIVNDLFKGQAIIAHGPILPGNWAYYDGIPKIEFDSYKSIEILKSAGYVLANEQDQVRSKDGKTLNFTMLYPDDDVHRSVAEAVQQNLAAVNVLVNLEAVSPDELINVRLAERNYEAALIDLNLSRIPDPDPYPFWDQTQISSGQNYSQWNNRIISQYLETARVETDLDERERLYRNFQVLFADEMPSLPLFTPVYNFAINSKIKGISVGPLYTSSDRFQTVESWYLISRPGISENATAIPKK
ncbi:MAG: peptide ABC transporter substrate-binding protein [Chloroflexi bacterium]|nr:peptide ABC transporter substrate-binding protein [Chloroflexota bacterium]